MQIKILMGVSKYELLSTPYITPICLKRNGMSKKYAGAYYVKLHQKNQIILEKNKNYDNKEIDTIEFKVFSSMYDALQQYDNGYIDFNARQNSQNVGHNEWEKTLKNYFGTLVYPACFLNAAYLFYT